jgi:cyclopropane-fatty-acyl-phospholipid synthase
VKPSVLALRPSPSVAAKVLRDIFGHVQEPFAFRLWDGREVRIGPGEPPVTVVFKSPEIFGRLMQDPSPGNFAEAYVSSDIDIDGDLYSAMSVANAIEGLHIPTRRKLRLLWTLWRS